MLPAAVAGYSKGRSRSIFCFIGK